MRQRQAIAGGIEVGVFIELGAETLGCKPWGTFVGQGDAGANQLIAHAVFDAALGRLFGAVAGVGDARFGDRVGQQEFRGLGIVAVLPGQALEHARHVAWVITGLFQIEDADAVGFLLVLPGKASLFLHGGRLGAGDHADASARGQHDTGQERGHHRQLHALLGFHAAGEVALRQVRQFVGQHRGILALGLGVEEQSAVDSDDAAGRGEGVELAAVDEDEFQAAVLQLAGFGQLVHAGLDVVLELWIVELIDLATQQTQPSATELVFLLRRNDGGAGITQRRQVVGVARKGHQAGQRQQGGAQ